MNNPLDRTGTWRTYSMADGLGLRVDAGSTLITARARYGPTNFRATQRFTVTVKPMKMYWVDSGTDDNDKIQRANITGTIAEIRNSVEDLFTSELDGPVSIALDLGDDK